MLKLDFVEIDVGQSQDDGPPSGKFYYESRSESLCVVCFAITKLLAVGSCGVMYHLLTVESTNRLVLLTTL